MSPLKFSLIFQTIPLKIFKISPTQVQVFSIMTDMSDNMYKVIVLKFI